MREQPPPQLVALLERLGLATGGGTTSGGTGGAASSFSRRLGRRLGRRVRRLARDLPRFESVWVDAAAQARILTPFQAAEINAGRGERLRIGDYVLCESVGWPDYVASYRARRLASGEVVSLVVVENAGARTDEIVAGLQALAAAFDRPRSEHLAPVTEVALDGNRIGAACRWIEGRTAATWMAHNGRMPPEVVLEIARAMLAGLVELEKAGICHGDISAQGLVLTSSGRVALLAPGVRAIVRPQEGYAFADLRPEAYDYLAPERIADGTGPTALSDAYACGCVWWHLLCGRPPLAGGSSLAKLRAAQAAEIADVRRLVPDVPGPLAAALSACLDPQPRGRSESMARLAATLGGSTRCGRAALARCLVQSGQPTARWPLSVRPFRRTRRPTGRSTTGATGRFPVASGSGLPLPWRTDHGWDRSVEPRVGRRRVWVWLGVLAGCLVAVVVGLCFPWYGRQTSSVDQKEPQAYSLQRPQPSRPGKQSEKPPSGESAPDQRPAGPVIAADYQAPPPPGKSAARPAAGLQDLVLAADGPLRMESLKVRAGQCVRGGPGKRPLVLVPSTGLAIDVEDVRFEDIDFVYHHSARGQAAPADQAGQGAVVQLRSGRAEFRGCTFRAMGSPATLPVAIRWTHPVDGGDPTLSLPSGRLQLHGCVFRQVDAAVDCRTVGALAVEITNTLQLGTGPLVRLDHCPQADEPLTVGLSEVTLRGSGPLLECRCRRAESQPGEILIRASRCALVPRPDAALLLFTGPESPEPLLRELRWTGQGSLVWADTVIAAWQPDGGRQQVLDDASVSIAGLVRSQVGFAAEVESGPDASRVVRWQAPLQTADPPGADPGSLPSSPWQCRPSGLELD